MRLIELKEKVRNTRIPKNIFQELTAIEVETVDEHSPSEKQQLADEMKRAQLSGNVFKTPLSQDSKIYLLHQAMPNLIDIAKDNMNKRMVKSLQKFQARLYAKVEGE